MSFINKFLYFFHLCPECSQKTTDWEDYQYCFSCFKEIEKPKKYKYRVRNSYKFTDINLKINSSWGTYKYYWLAWINLTLDEILDNDINSKWWISKEEIGRKRKPRNK